MNDSKAVRATKLVLAVVLAVPSLGLAIAAVVDASVLCGLLALAFAAWPVAVFLDSTNGFATDPAVLDEHTDAVAKREHHWRYFNPANPASPFNQFRRD